MKILTLLFCLLASCFSFAAPERLSIGNQLAAEELFVKAKGAKLFCRVFGKGDPIIVIHGGPGLSQDYLLPQMSRLAETNLVIFYDGRGCGLSSGKLDDASISIETYLNDIEAIRKSFGYKKVTILGHSWGGFLAMHYAIKYPRCTQKLILLNTMAASLEEFGQFMDEWAKRMTPYLGELKGIKESDSFGLGDSQVVARYYQIMFKRYCYDSTKADLLNLVMSPKACVDGAQVFEIFRQNVFSKPYNLHAELKQLKIPTLIVHGDFDPIPSSTAESIHESIAGSEYVCLPNCGHFPYVETPDILFKHLQKFLAKNP